MGRSTHTIQTLLKSYRYMYMSRVIDILEQEFAARGEVFFHVSGAGHEATAILNNFLTPDDWLHCHYRDKALLLARGISAEMFLYSTFNKDASHSRGRQMNAHMSAPELRVLSTVGPVGNSALHAVGVAEAIMNEGAAAAQSTSAPEETPIVLCSLGDGMTQEGEVLEAIGHAAAESLPVFFLIQDNHFAISTKTTGKTFYSLPDGNAHSFYGIEIDYIDGKDSASAYAAFDTITKNMRAKVKPAIAVFNVQRLDNHTNADDQKIYRTNEEIAQGWKQNDPVTLLRTMLLDDGIPESQLGQLETQIEADIKETAAKVMRAAEPKPTFSALKPLPPQLQYGQPAYTGSQENMPEGEQPLTMLHAIKKVLHSHLTNDSRVVLFGEDIEDPKGDVFGITKGLSKEFPKRVKNSPLAEASIVGISIGQALAGNRPVAFLQFADFLPIAYNQIFAELGSMYWRTDGSWQSPVIVMITCGGYRPGLGPFHASSMEALAIHTPGIDICMPSSAGDAAALLNAAFQSERPTLFFYPKSLLNDRSAATSPDVERHIVPLGTARKIYHGTDITMVGWGNTVPLCAHAAATLQSNQVSVDLIDLRCLMPWDISMVAESVRTTKRLLVAHEDNHSAGFGAEIIAAVTERVDEHIHVCRVTRGDTYVPCNFANQLEVLPSYKRIMEQAVALLNGTLRWHPIPRAAEGTQFIEAIGSSPSDESVTVTKWYVDTGAHIKEGDLITDLEADKAAVELRAPIAGKMVEKLVEVGGFVKVGTPLATIQLEDTGGERSFVKPITREEIADATIDIPPRQTSHTAHTPHFGKSASPGTALEPDSTIAITQITSMLGSRVVTNEEICEKCARWTPQDILQRTGIETRHWLADGETLTDLAYRAVEKLLTASQLTIEDFDLILCTTETPMQNTPSIATFIQGQFKKQDGYLSPAYDLNAACSGYLYALGIAHDWLTSTGSGRILILTCEGLSPFLDPTDPSTAPIFGDASTATIVTVLPKDAPHPKGAARIFRPITGANGEDGKLLNVPVHGKGYIAMDGVPVFAKAVRAMITSVRMACTQLGIEVEDIGYFVPHQANQRIINAVGQRLSLPKEKIYSNIRHLGNTSSSTIPLCLENLLPTRPQNEYIGLTAFGGGLTFGGGILQIV